MIVIVMVRREGRLIRFITFFSSLFFFYVYIPFGTHIRGSVSYYFSYFIYSYSY